MPVRVSCPYCNAGFALFAVPPSGRADCPRCGERFPVRLGEADAPGAPPAAVAPAAVAPAAAPPPAPPRSGRWLLPVSLVVFALAAGYGVYRFRTNPTPPGPDLPPDAAAVPPLSLRGLGYLPPGTNVAFAVRPGPVLEYAARTGQDPVQLLTKAGVPAAALGALGKAGVTLQQIDHVAGGVAVPDATGGELRFAVALVLRRPVADEDDFLEALKARRTGGGRYEVEAGGVPLNLARASDTDWVFGWGGKDADATGGRELPPGLREVVDQKVPAEAAAWAATDSARWADKPAVKLAVGAVGRKEWLPLLEQGRAAVASVSLGESPRVRAGVRCADAPTADRLRTYFRSKATGEVGGEGDWAAIDLSYDPAAGTGPFRTMLDDAGR